MFCIKKGCPTCSFLAANIQARPAASLACLHGPFFCWRSAMSFACVSLKLVPNPKETLFNSALAVARNPETEIKCKLRFKCVRRHYVVTNPSPAASSSRSQCNKGMTSKQKNKFTSEISLNVSGMRNNALIISHWAKHTSSKYAHGALFHSFVHFAQHTESSNKKTLEKALRISMLFCAFAINEAAPLSHLPTGCQQESLWTRPLGKNTHSIHSLSFLRFLHSRFVSYHTKILPRMRSKAIHIPYTRLEKVFW